MFITIEDYKKTLVFTRLG